MTAAEATTKLGELIATMRQSERAGTLTVDAWRALYEQAGAVVAPFVDEGMGDGLEPFLTVGSMYGWVDDEGVPV